MTKISTIRKHLGYSGFPLGTYGLEIETEVKLQKDYPNGFLMHVSNDEEGHKIFETPKMKKWIAKTDGSLRNYGIEYIFKAPYTFEDSVAALKEFEEATRGIPFLKDQPSTSVHVHINVSNETPLVMANFITVWMLFENLLLDFSGPTRRSSCFAQGSRIAEEVVANCVKMFKTLSKSPNGIVFSQQHVKYAALNLGCLAKLGSLEIRSFRGTTDVDEIILWLSIIDKILEFSRTPGLTPKEFFTSYHQKGIELLSDVFGQYSSLLKCEGYIEMIERQEKYLYDIVTSVKNWETFGLDYEALTQKIEKSRSKKTATQDFLQQAQQAYTLATNAPDAFPTTVDEFYDFEE